MRQSKAPPERILAAELGDDQLARVEPTRASGQVGAWLALPSVPWPQGRLLVVMHGVRRNAREYLETWRAWSQRTGRPVLAPHFDAGGWPGARGYNLGNVLGADGTLDPRREWAFTALLGQVAAAGAGWFTVPDPGIDWPYGTRHDGLGVDDASLTRWVRRPLLLLRAEHDRHRDEYLRVDAPADAQGQTRWDRARAHRCPRCGPQRAGDRTGRPATLGTSLTWQLSRAVLRPPARRVPR